MTEVYIQGINMSQYGLKAKPSGSISIAGALSANFSLTEEESEELAAIARKIFARRQHTFARQVEEAVVTSPMIGVTRTIDAIDDTPF